VFDKQIDQLMFDFNLNPARYIDVSWVPESLRHTWLRVNQANGEASAYASHWAMKYFELTGQVDFDFTRAEKRLLLLDAASLKEIVLALGLASMKQDIQQWIQKDQLAKLKLQLGDEMFEFFFDVIVSSKHAVRVPAQSLNVRDTLFTSVATGLTLLVSCIGEAGAASVRRATLKLPKPYVARSKLVELSEARKQRITEFCIDCVVRNRLPQWHWLF
jgi:type III secretion protein K